MSAGANVAQSNAGGLGQAVAHLSETVDRMEAAVLQFFEAAASRRLVERPDDPAILRDPRVRAAGIRLSDVNLDDYAADGPEPVEAEDPQERLDRLAEEWAADHGVSLSDGYRAVARARPGLWLEAREAADLNGQNDVDDANNEVARLIDQYVADYGLGEAAHMVWYKRPDLFRRVRGL